MNDKNSNINTDTSAAICVKNLTKSFRIPHQKIDTVRGAFVNTFSRKTFDEFKALDDVSFTIPKGKFVGILGHNGSGKSTLLKILANVYCPGSGSVAIDGQVSPFLELGIGFNLELSGRDNIYLNATILGLTPKEIDERFDDIVAFSEIGKFIDQQVKNYSSGMQGRLAFSVSIHANRDILLMDEVLAVGDAKFQKKCLAQFAEYKDLNKTVVLVTHDVSAVRNYCDSAILLHHGKLLISGDVDEVVDEYLRVNLPELASATERGDVEKQLNSVDEPAVEVSTDDHDEDQMAIRKERQGYVTITHVEFCGGRCELSNIFNSGDDLNVRVYFKVKNMPDTIQCGLTILSQTGAYVSGVNTAIDKVDLARSIERGYFEVSYKSIPLATGEYSILASITDSDWDDPFAIIEEPVSFSVQSSRESNGIVYFDYEWV